MFNTLFTERELAEDAAGRWWMFLVTGIGWLVFSLLVFQWDYTTVYAISILFGIVALVAGINEFFQIVVSSTGWKVVHGILGVLYVIVGVWALVNPRSAFTTLAALVAFFLLFKGIFDLTVAFMSGRRRPARGRSSCQRSHGRSARDSCSRRTPGCS